jgi:RNA 3'-terminal phosphate cyclase
MGVEVKLEKVKKGYYPKGGGSITYTVKVKKLVPIQMLDFEPPMNVLVTYYGKKNNIPEGHQELKKEVKRMMKQTFDDVHMDFEFKTELTPGTKGDNYGIGCLLRN